MTTLRDTNDELWKKIARGKMPRVYLLDSKGKIIWMDVEYSRGTERDLGKAIKASL